MRSEDLIPAFGGHLGYLMEGRRLTREQRKRYGALLNLCFRPKGRDDDGLVDALFAALDELAAPYSYFGAHEGDGSDYGYWPSLEQAEEECVKVDAGDELPRGTDVLIVSDHGNATCGHVDRQGELTVYWEVV
jgi:hypothetical protein